MLYWKAEKKIPEQNKLGHNISSYCLSFVPRNLAGPFPEICIDVTSCHPSSFTSARLF